MPGWSRALNAVFMPGGSRIAALLNYLNQTHITYRYILESVWIVQTMFTFIDLEVEGIHKGSR